MLIINISFSVIIVQHAKKVVSDSLGLVDFAIGLVNSVINLPKGQVKFIKEFKLQKNCEINLLIKTFLGLAEMMFGLVNVSFSLPEWQAVKMTFFAPCCHTLIIIWAAIMDCFPGQNNNIQSCICYVWKCLVWGSDWRRMSGYNISNLPKIYLMEKVS